MALELILGPCAYVQVQYVLCMKLAQFCTYVLKHVGKMYYIRPNAFLHE